MSGIKIIQVFCWGVGEREEMKIINDIPLHRLKLEGRYVRVHYTIIFTFVYLQNFQNKTSFVYIK